jgi:arylsulfatase A-like enzyme
MLASPQVQAVFTAGELARAGRLALPVDEWSLVDRVRANFDGARSGDLYMLLKPHVIPIAEPGKGYATTHGSIWNYDRRVPMLFWWPGISGYEQPVAVETVDILPTLAALIDLAVPADQIDGRCLDLDPGPASTCPTS